MPGRNTVRVYVSNGYYHIYNRGVEKRTIFLDESDYKMFLYYLFLYLAPSELIQKIYPNLKIALKNGNLHSKLTIHSYVLMPNHFHFLLHQTEGKYITQFMRRFTNAYTRYFNEKYERVGALFQGVFKSVLIDKDDYLIHLSGYIHRNPLSLSEHKNNLKEYIWSSYRTYLGIQNSSYVNSNYILQFFSKNNPSLTYQAFVETENNHQIPSEYLIEE